MSDEKRLVRRLQAGDRQAFEEFLDAYGGRVHRLVLRYVPNRADAEDVTQEIFCDLHRSLPKFRGESALGTWVYRVAVNHCLKHCQRAKPDSLPYDEAALAVASDDWRDSPERSLSQQELSDQVQGALQQLSPLHSDVVILCELHGLTYQECAQALDIPVGTVKSRLSNAFRKLRESLANYVLEDGRLSAKPIQTIKEGAR